MSDRKAAAVSMPKDLAAQAVDRAKALGFSTFSAYVVQLIRQDLAQRGTLVIQENQKASGIELPKEPSIIHH